MDNSHFDNRHLYKILLVGGDKSGKTKILHKFISEMHAQNFKCAIGIEFGIETIIIEGKCTKIQISDTSRYIKGVDGVVLIYDVTDLDSFDKLGSYLEKIESITFNNIPIILCGNKIESEGNRVISSEEGMKFSCLHGLPFIEVSAKLGKNIELMFDLIVAEIKHKVVKY